MDGTACAVAYAELLTAQGKEAVAAISGPPHIEARHVLGELGMDIPTALPAYDEVAILDVCRYDQLDPAIAAEDVITVIDHRRGGVPEDFPHAKDWQVELVGAAATLVYERWRDADLTPSANSAKLLQAAILSNTVNLKAAVTTERDHVAMAALSEIAPLGDGFAHRMFQAKSDMAGPKLREALYADKSRFEANGWSITFFQLEIIGTQELLETREQEIREIIASSGSDRALLSLLDIERGTTILLIPNADFAEMAGQALSCAFDQAGIATLDRIMMRKEVRPAIQAYFGEAALA